ncbi:dienelactone hydrolase family protein [Pelagerythrobacter rhizovicinus]|uniref:Dienelactone hydrolase family protein n=1 Tax=Pelagerythrobacter rhizovicinus TaxID=2268576 RepID=A0A4Q2KR85_9SPHN|nr:dienelactone hydrolase family protein [Pelagerythrobacter rhizovicinus]RXZ66162.1 dienelactone hydrolase family protein [Pelagerythrobacter rhizovicinus]
MERLEPISYRDGETALTGHLARPAGKPRAAIAVFPTIMNSTPAVEAKACVLAEAGYLAMICDFYGRQPDGPVAFEWADALRADTGAWRARLRAGLAALREIAPDLRQAAIGFCMGGQAVLELARDGAELALVTSFHGLLETKAPAAPGSVKARILVCHGDADPLVPREHVLRFWEEMDRAGADWHFHGYSGVKHGFTNPDPPSGNPVVDYDASADRQSWAAMGEMLAEVLDQAARA